MPLIILLLLQIVILCSIFSGVVRKPKSASRPKSVTEQTASSPNLRRQHAQSAANLSKCISVRPLSRDKGEQKAPPLHDNWVTDQEMDDEVNFYTVVLGVFLRCMNRKDQHKVIGFITGHWTST